MLYEPVCGKIHSFMLFLDGTGRVIARLHGRHAAYNHRIVLIVRRRNTLRLNSSRRPPSR